jgi:hypothetical protein
MGVWEAHSSSQNHIVALKKRIKKDLESSVEKRDNLCSLIPTFLIPEENGGAVKRPRLD